MPDNKSPNFSQIVSSSPSVRAAFAVHRPTRFWWNLILMLHGKPVNPSLSRAAKTKRIADGFKFYAWLYRFLAIIFFLLTPTFMTLNVTGNSDVSSYWATASFLAAVYLWCVSNLGYAGAKAYGTGQGTSSLTAFMVMIVAFLSMFVAVVSVVAQHCAWLGIVPNLVAASTLFVFGVGSYMIEIIYLATEHHV